MCVNRFWSLDIWNIKPLQILSPMEFFHELFYLHILFVCLFVFLTRNKCINLDLWVPLLPLTNNGVIQLIWIYCFFFFTIIHIPSPWAVFRPWPSFFAHYCLLFIRGYNFKPWFSFAKDVDINGNAIYDFFI